MKIKRLLLTELSTNFFLSYLAFFTIALSLEFVDKIDDLITIKVGTIGILKYFLFRLPYIHSQISLYSTMIAVMITLNILSQKNEITALLSSGIKVNRIFYIFLIFITLTSSLTFLVDNFITPKYNQKSEKLLKGILSPTSTNLTNIFFKTDDGFLFVNFFIPEKNILLNTYLVTLSKNYERIDKVIHVKTITEEENKWIARDAIIYDFPSQKSQRLSMFQIPEIEFLKTLSKNSAKSEFFTLEELIKTIYTAKSFGIDVTLFYYYITTKLINFLSFFALFYLIFPFGFQLGRNKKNMEIIFIGIIILLAYTVFQSFVIKIFRPMGVNPIIPLLTLFTPLFVSGRLNWKRHFH